MKSISREVLNEQLTNDGVTLVEVLPPEYYRKFHLPGFDYEAGKVDWQQAGFPTET